MGIGIGTVGAVALLAAVALLLLLVRRRRKKQAAATTTTTQNNANYAAVATTEGGAAPPSYPGNGGGMQLAPNMSDKSPAGPQFWGPGNVGNNTSTMYQTGFKHELPADQSSGGVVSAAAVSPNLSTVSPDHRSSEATGFFVSPQSTGTGTGHHGTDSHGHNGHISELSG